MRHAAALGAALLLSCGGSPAPIVPSTSAAPARLSPIAATSAPAAGMEHSRRQQGACRDPDDWVRLAVERVAACSRSGPADRDVFGVELAIENRDDDALLLRDTLYVADEQGRRRATTLPPYRSDCTVESSSSLVQSRQTGKHWLFFEGAPAPGLHLKGTLDEPHGFEAWRFDVPIGGTLPQCASPPPLDAKPPPAEPGVAPPVTRRWFRVTVMGKKICNGGQPVGDGSVLLGVDVLVENFSDAVIEAPYTAKVKDARGYEFGSVITEQAGCEPKMSVGTYVKPGDKYRGFVWGMPVRADAKALRLLYAVRSGALGTHDELDIPIGDLPKP